MKIIQLKILLLGFAFFLIGCENTKNEPSPTDDMIEQPSGPIPDSGDATGDGYVIDYPEEPEEPKEPTDLFSEELELPPVEQPEEEEKPQPEQPQEEKLNEPTQENPVVANIEFGTATHLSWLPKDDVDFYRVYSRPPSRVSYILVADKVNKPEYLNYETKPGNHFIYRIVGVKGDNRQVLGQIEIEIPETEEVTSDVSLPEVGVDPPVKVYEIDIPDTKGVDLTNAVQAQIDAVPNGTSERYNLIRFADTDRRIWTEGDLKNNIRGHQGVIQLIGRRFLILEGADDFITFYTKAPAVPQGSSVNKNTQSKRAHFRIRQSANIIFRNIAVEGANTIRGRDIGTTPELSPEWWTSDTYDTGAIRDAGVWEAEWESEHGFDVRESVNIRFDNVRVYGVFGDGIYFSHSENVEVHNSTVDMAGRQSYGFGPDVFMFKVLRSEALRPRRAALDMEPDLEGKILNGEIAYSYFDSHISAGGNGEISNINFHHNKHRGSAHILGEAHENRKNWNWTDNEMIAGHGSPTYAITFEHIENVTYERNTSFIHDTQGRRAVLFRNCSSKISVKDNDWTNPSIVMLKDCAEGTKLIFEGNTPDPLLVIDKDGEREFSGNMELSEKLEGKNI